MLKQQREHNAVAGPGPAAGFGPLAATQFRRTHSSLDAQTIDALTRHMKGPTLGRMDTLGRVETLGRVDSMSSRSVRDAVRQLEGSGINTQSSLPPGTGSRNTSLTPQQIQILLGNFRDTREGEQPSLQRVESLAPTPLRPGISSTLRQNSIPEGAAPAPPTPVAAPTNGAPPKYDEGMEAFLKNRRMKGRVTSDEERMFSAKLLEARNAAARNSGAPQSAPFQASFAPSDEAFKSLMAANREATAPAATRQAMARPHRQTSTGSVDLLVAAAVIHSSAAAGLRPGKNDSDLLSDDDENDGGGDQGDDRQASTTSIDGAQERKKREWMHHIGKVRDRPQSNPALPDARQPQAGKSATVTPASGSATNTADWEAIKVMMGNTAQSLQPGKNEDDLLDDDDSGDEGVKATKISKKAFKRRRESSQESSSLGGKFTKKKAGKFKRKKGTTESPGANEYPRPVLHDEGTSLNSVEMGATLGKTKTNDGPTGLQDIDDNAADEHSFASFNVSRGVSFSRGISLFRGFSRGGDGIPVKETMLDRGHSLALSEVSLDRGMSSSMNVFENEGQFDDASEDEKQESKTPSFGRETTTGTIGTFTSPGSERMG